MNKNSMKRLLSLFLCLALIAAMALSMTGCKDDSKEPTEPTTTEAPIENEGTVLGEGATSFAFTVVDVEGNESHFTIKTDKKTVGEALLELGIIDGEQGDYGLYVKTVGGKTLDYDKDGMYWSFYVNGNYAMSGVDTTPIVAGETYAFKAENA